MTVDIRFARATDLPDIVELSNWAAKHTTANFALEPEPLEDWQASFEATRRSHPWLVGSDGGAFVGFAKAAPWKGRCAYTWAAETTVYVRREHHGRGVGRALYSQLIKTTRAQGFRTLMAGISLPNPASIRLHEALGFKRAGVFEKIGYKFGAWHDVGYWQLALGDGGDGEPTPLEPVPEP